MLFERTTLTPSLPLADARVRLKKELRAHQNSPLVLKHTATTRDEARRPLGPMSKTARSSEL